MPSFLIIAGSALMALTSPQVAYAQSLQPSFPVAEVSTTTPEGIKSLLEARFGSTSPMVRVATCESSYEQLDASGAPLRNPGSSATGVFQILASVHGASALKMGFDINTLEGNVGYANILYKANGLVPWTESKPCWSK